MSADVYEVLSLAMRYWFAFLGVVIVWRAFSWLRKDRRLKHKRLRQLPDAGTIGELVVMAGSRELPEGSVIPVPHEGVLGFVRANDMVVPVQGVARQHLDFSFRDGHGLYIYPRRGCPCTVDGVDLTSRKLSRAYPMQHGSYLTIGEATLRLRVFAGLDVQQLADYMPEDPYPAYEDEPYQEDEPFEDIEPQDCMPHQGVPVMPQQPYQPPLHNPYAPHQGIPQPQQPYWQMNPNDWRQPDDQ
ncbi:MAG: hypothetical protein IJ438_13805 [Clostridia bacterium]|nr:hypothetical protein [Clostridia bacterium]